MVLRIVAPNVTVSLANFYLAEADFGIKWHGLAFNTEWTSRWLDQQTQSLSTRPALEAVGTS